MEVDDEQGATEMHLKKIIDRKTIRRNKNAGQDTFFVPGQEMKVETPEGVRVTRKVSMIHTFDPVPEFSYQYLPTEIHCIFCGGTSIEDELILDEVDGSYDELCPHCRAVLDFTVEIEKLTKEKLGEIADANEQG